QRDVEEHVDDIHELEKSRCVGLAVTLDLRSGLVTVSPEDQRRAVRMQVNITRRQLYRPESMPLEIKFLRNMGVNPHRHHVQRTGMDEMLWRLGDQVSRGSHAADFVQGFKH